MLTLEKCYDIALVPVATKLISLSFAALVSYRWRCLLIIIMTKGIMQIYHG